MPINSLPDGVDVTGESGHPSRREGVAHEDAVPEEKLDGEGELARDTAQGGSGQGGSEEAEVAVKLLDGGIEFGA